MTELAERNISARFEREINRFVVFASRHGNPVLYHNRRASARIHRSTPVLFTRIDDGPGADHPATLYNVSNDGVAFYCDHGLPAGAVLAVKLFWKESESSRVPAIVRHCEITQQGFLVGAQFAVHHHGACDLIESLAHTWYD
ncbi:MAG TPA: PilZ domain-containing protein [Phycisphaerae bacterium]|nr:PilZ domain-containing protein [Phycisphaerae bacterium]